MGEIYAKTDQGRLAAENAAMRMARKSRAATKAARLAERDRAYAAHCEANGIREAVTYAPSGLKVTRRGYCPNYAGVFTGLTK